MFLSQRVNNAGVIAVAVMIAVHSAFTYGQSAPTTPEKSPSQHRPAAKAANAAGTVASAAKLVAEADDLIRPRDEDKQCPSCEGTRFSGETIGHAAALYEKAAKLGDPRGQMMYAEFLLTYSGMCNDKPTEQYQACITAKFTHARDLLRKSAQQKYQPGQIRLIEEELAGLYDCQVGLPSNVAKGDYNNAPSYDTSGSLIYQIGAADAWGHAVAWHNNGWGYSYEQCQSHNYNNPACELVGGLWYADLTDVLTLVIGGYTPDYLPLHYDTSENSFFGVVRVDLHVTRRGKGALEGVQSNFKCDKRPPLAGDARGILFQVGN
ncbi:MAG TPA: hypothetical protein VGM18_11030 [Candidatus Sulfotelmatobacter sp.]|jgi:hypothetical protein